MLVELDYTFQFTRSLFFRPGAACRRFIASSLSGL
jgi:hypothetical protein